MWFNSALIYTIKNQPENLSSLLSEHALKPCPPHAKFIYGWLPVLNHEFSHDIMGASLIAMGKEERLLPRGVIKKLLHEQIQRLEAERGYPVKRAEKAQLAEELEFDLLPKAFCVQKQIYGLIDHREQRLIINTSSPQQAGQFIALLKKSISGLQVEPLQFNENLALRFADWIKQSIPLPSSLQLAADCLLVSLDNDKKRFRCQGYELPAQEVLNLLTDGLVASQLSMTWNDRVQFTFCQDFSLKKLKCMDYLIDELHDIKKLDDETQQQDAALALLSGELRLLINELGDALQCNTIQEAVLNV